MNGARDEIVAALRQHGERTIAQLAEAVGITPAALRRHLDILAGEGMVEHRAVRQATGRPFFLYRLSERAQEAASDYPRLLERFVTEVATLGREEIASKDGRDLLETVFGHMSEHLAADYQDRVHGETLSERLDSLTEALRDEGLVERWEERPDGYHLSTSLCPHRRAAVLTPGLCSAEARAIASLLGAAVEQTGRLVDGAPLCEYLVRGEPSRDWTIPIEEISDSSRSGRARSASAEQQGEASA